MSLARCGSLVVTVLAAMAVLVASGCALLSRAPAADRSETQPTPKRPFTYTVKKGDSLYAIAWRYQFDYRDLAATNNIRDPYIIYPGDVINLRVKEGARFEPPPPGPMKTAPRSPQRQAQAVDSRKRAETTREAPRNATPQVASPAKPAKPVTRPQPAALAPKRAVAASQQPAPARPGATGGWRHPVGVRPTQAFGRGNLGQDYVLNPGAKVVSASGGVVMYAGPGLGGYRHLVIVKASNQYLAAYGLNVEPVVREGQAVQAGQVLAAIDGDALSRRFHFEVRRDGKPVDPKPLIGS